MTIAVGDLIQETTSTTGTGALTLSGAVAGYQSFAVIGTGNTTYYCIRSGTNKEVGIGTYTASGTTLSRDTVLYSSAGGTTKITVAAGATVINTYPAETAISGGGGGTYPTTQPSLNLDFANTKQLDPRITFVRNSTAAYYDGQTSAMAEQNLLLQSNTFSNAAWVATNGTVASGVTDPAGTTTAFSFTATGVATLYQTLTTTATPYTLSFYIQRVTGTGAVNLTLDGTILTPQTITGSWVRYSVTATPTAASHTIGIQLAVITDSVNIFSSQLENRSSMTAANITTTAAITNYIPVLMTAPAGVARFDCDPITRNSLGLLIEESRVNLLTYSSNMATAPWGPANLVLTQSTIISPDGTLNGITFTRLTTTSAEAPSRYSSAQVVSAPYTVSVYAKVGTTNNSLYIRNLAIDSTVSTGLVKFNLTAGTIDLTLGSTYTGKAFITAVGNGWYRCSISGTTPATIVNNLVDIGVTSSGTIGGTAGDYLFAWGAQLEAGSFATSYIPTVASTVTRAADVASMTGANFSSWYNQAQGSFYQESLVLSTVNTNGTVFAVKQGTTANYILSRYTGDQSPILYAGGVNVVNLNAGTLPVGVLGKLAWAHDLTVFTASRNAGTPVTATATATVPTMDTLFIGAYSPTQLTLGGYIRKLSYYPVALSSSSLVALTS